MFYAVEDVCGPRARPAVGLYDTHATQHCGLRAVDRPKEISRKVVVESMKKKFGSRVARPHSLARVYPGMHYDMHYDVLLHVLCRVSRKSS